MRTLAAAVALALSLAACGSDDDPPVERPLVFGGDRPVTLQVPSSFEPSQTYPLMIVLHGYGVTGFVQQGYLGLGGVPSTHGMLVLAPEGTPDSGGSQFWNADPACCDFGGIGVDDVGYLGGLVDAVKGAWPVDPSHVAVVGHSNGAFMAYRLACERADVITAIAGLAGHATSTPCTPSRPVHVLHIHGTTDAIVPYESGLFSGVQSPGAVESVAQWATRNGCAGGPSPQDPKDLERTIAGAETAVAMTSRCPADGAGDLWTIAGGSHQPAFGPGFATELLEWLAAHGR